MAPYAYDLVGDPCHEIKSDEGSKPSILPQEEKEKWELMKVAI
jgi:hypothetical protein